MRENEIWKDSKLSHWNSQECQDGNFLQTGLEMYYNPQQNSSRLFWRNLQAGTESIWKQELRIVKTVLNIKELGM